LLSAQKDEQASYTSIAQPVKTNKVANKITKAPYSTIKTTVTTQAPKIEVAKRNFELLEKQQIIIYEDQQFNTQLDSLSASSSIQTKEIIKNNITSDSMMVEEAFKRSSSSNPYQEEIAKLATSPEPKAVITDKLNEQVTATPQTKLLAKTLSTNNYSPLANHKADSTGLAIIEHSFENSKLTTNNSTNIALAKSKEIILAEPVWQNAEQLKSVDPVYPSVAKRKGIEIEVTVNFTIDIDGQIKNISFARQNKINYFKSSIRSAIKKWRFLPAKVNNQPVESQMSKVFAFSLQS